MCRDTSSWLHSADSGEEGTHLLYESDYAYRAPGRVFRTPRTVSGGGPPGNSQAPLGPTWRLVGQALRRRTLKRNAPAEANAISAKEANGTNQPGTPVPVVDSLFTPRVPASVNGPVVVGDGMALAAGGCVVAGADEDRSLALVDERI